VTLQAGHRLDKSWSTGTTRRRDALFPPGSYRTAVRYLCKGIPRTTKGVVMRQGSRLGSVVSLATLALLILPFGAQASTNQAVTLAHWWQAKGNAKDSVGTDNGKLVGVGFGPGVKGGNDQAFAFYGGAHQVVFNKTGGNRGDGDFTFSF